MFDHLLGEVFMCNSRTLTLLIQDFMSVLSHDVLGSYVHITTVSIPL